MNNCIITKLNAEFSDNTLPVFSHYDFKDYLYTTEAGQSIDVSSIIGSLAFNNVKIEMTFKIRNFTSVDSIWVFGVRSKNISIGAEGNTGKVQVMAGTTVKASTAVLNEDVSVVLDTKANTVTIGETTLDVSVSSTSAINYASVFSSFSSNTPTSEPANNFALKHIKFTNPTTNAVLADMYPCIIDNAPCLFDSVNKTAYYERNGGTLGAE